MTQFARNSQQDAPWVWFHAGALSVSLFLMLSLVGFIGFQAAGYFWPKPLQWIEVAAEDGRSIHLWGQQILSQELPRMQSQLKGLPLNSRQRLMFLGDQPSELSRVEPQRTHQTPEAYLWVNDVESKAASALLKGFSLNDIALIQLTTGSRLLMKPMGWFDRDKRPLAQPAVNEQQQAVEVPSLPATIALDNPSFWPKQARFVQFIDAQQQQYWVPVEQIAWAFYPNRLTLMEGLNLFALSVWHFVSGANVSGQQQGVWPAILGTVLMVFLMTLLVTPLGICAAIYLHEYAPKNKIMRLVRVGVSNMAAVPSIVYGVFGLGFFVHAMGSVLDQMTGQMEPVWETPGLLWAGLTLALMTLPVVIITTEEGLARVPLRLREASLALGATQAETLWKVVMPLVTPAMMTGVILAIARAAGEVAPLMLVGVVKLAPALPINEHFPYMHLEQPFMHLGYHIYETALFDPRGDVSRPLVYAMAALLVLVIIFLNLFAIRIRQRMRERYRAVDL
jgi:phosphate transport system permease protein